MPVLDVVVVIRSKNGKVDAIETSLFYGTKLEMWEEIAERFHNITQCRVEWVLRSGLECDLKRSLDYYMHGVVLQSPPWIFVVRPEDRFYVFVAMVGREEVHVGVTPDLSVKRLKEELVGKFDVPADKQRLIFKGKQLEDGQSLTSYGLKADDRVLLTMRMSGGMGPTKLNVPVVKPFADVSRRELGKLVDTVPCTVSWQGLCSGLNLKGKCQNQACRAASTKDYVIDKKGYGDFDVVLDKCACPECGSRFDPMTCGFHYCEWSFKGAKMVNDIAQPVNGGWESVASGKYLCFDDQQRNRVRWARLLLHARPPLALQKKCSLCNGLLVSDKEFVSPCDHVFHDACWTAFKDLRRSKSGVGNGVLCPVCQKNVPV